MRWRSSRGRGPLQDASTGGNPAATSCAAFWYGSVNLPVFRAYHRAIGPSMPGPLYAFDGRVVVTTVFPSLPLGNWQRSSRPLECGLYLTK